MNEDSHARCGVRAFVSMQSEGLRLPLRIAAASRYARADDLTAAVPGSCVDKSYECVDRS